ncbi:MAG: DUF3142 domain-containing protein [Myxococcota bacterium]
MRRRLLLAVALLGLTPTAPRQSAPELWLWAWEHPQDLRFVHPQTGIAFLAETVELRPSGIVSHPRRQPLLVRPGQRLVAVVRIEFDANDVPVPDPAVRKAIAARVRRAARLPGVQGVQIDFDANTSQRHAYALLLRELRRTLPDGIALSMTALASWCQGDTWLDVPVDEVVPMLFEMGPEGREIRRYVERNGGLRSPRCRDSVGQMVGRPWVASSARRIFVFHRGPWTEVAYARVRRRLG